MNADELNRLESQCGLAVEITLDTEVVNSLIQDYRDAIAALEKYGKHHDKCFSLGYQIGGKRWRCNCGFFNALGADAKVE